MSFGEQGVPQSIQRREDVPRKETTAWTRSNVLRMKFQSSNTFSSKGNWKSAVVELAGVHRSLHSGALCTHNQEFLQYGKGM